MSASLVLSHFRYARFVRASSVHLLPYYREFARNALGGSHKKKVHGIRKSPIDQIDQLDFSGGNDIRGVGSGAKLRKSLTKADEAVLDAASQGALDATGEEIRDVLNDFLDSSKFAYAFKGFKSGAELVEIVDVRCNNDYSNVHAYWRASSMELIVKSMEIKHGEVEARKLAGKVVKTIDNVFRDKQGLMRSNLMRKMHFKRVPKIVYGPKDASLGLNPPLESLHAFVMHKGMVHEYNGADDMDSQFAEEGLRSHSSNRYSQSQSEGDSDLEEWSEGDEENDQDNGDDDSDWEKDAMNEDHMEEVKSTRRTKR